MSGDGALEREAEQERLAEEQRQVDLENERLRIAFSLQVSDQGLTIALPSGKSMEESTLAHLKAAHVAVAKTHPRLCATDIKGLPGFSRGTFFKPSQIPDLVAKGEFAVGITGLDAVIESRAGDKVNVVATIPYSRAGNGGTRGVLFRRRGESGSRSGLAELRLQKKLRIVSEYPVATRKFLESQGIEAIVIPCTGSAESFVVSGMYDWGVALVETGTSLKVNGLEEVATVFESQTVLIANEQAYANMAVKGYADFLGRLLVGIVEARDNRYIKMNAPVSAAEEIMKILPARKSADVQMLADPEFCSIASVVPIEGLNELKRKLGELGATAIVEFDHESIV